MSELTGLTEVTASNIPNDVGLKVRPPETLRNKGCGRIDSFVRNIVVCLSENFESMVWPDDKSVRSGGSCTSPETSILDIEPCSMSVKGSERIIGKVGRTNERCKVIVNV